MKVKRILFVLLALVIGGAMASCNGDGGGDEDVDADVQQEDIPSEAEIEVPPDVPTEDVQVDDVTHDQEDTVERDGIARLDVQAVDLDLRAQLDAMLLAAGFDDCVHGVPVAWRTCV